MPEHRKVSSAVSMALANYVLDRAKLTQEQFAEALEVSPGFISRVRAQQRSFTVDHLGAIETLMEVPLGALLLAAVPLPEPTARTKKLHELARQAIEQADVAAQTLRRRDSSVAAR